MFIGPIRTNRVLASATEHTPRRKKRKVEPPRILLFIAHGGVHNGPLWTAWRNQLGTHQPCIFYVHAPPDVDQFSNTHNISHIGLQYNADTGWCRESLPVVYLACMEAICQQHATTTPDAIVYLVSGHDIPMVPAQTLFHYNTQCKLCIQEFRRTQNRRFPMHIIAQQWIALNLRQFTSMKTTWRGDLARFFALQYTSVMGNTDFRIGSDSIKGCPDETFIPFQLGKHGINMSNDYCTTLDPRPYRNAPSPLVWNSFDEGHAHIALFPPYPRLQHVTFLGAIAVYKLWQMLEAQWTTILTTSNVPKTTVAAMVEGMNAQDQPVFLFCRKIGFTLQKNDIQTTMQKCINPHVAQQFQVDLLHNFCQSKADMGPKSTYLSISIAIVQAVNTTLRNVQKQPIVLTTGHTPPPLPDRSRLDGVREAIRREIRQFGDLRLQGTQAFLTNADALKGNSPVSDPTLVTTSEIVEANEFLQDALQQVQVLPVATAGTVQSDTIGNTRLSRTRRVDDVAILARFVALYTMAKARKDLILQSVTKQWLQQHQNRLLKWNQLSAMSTSKHA